MVTRPRGKGSIFKVKGKNRDGTPRESSNWYIAWWEKGRQVREATGSSDREYAERLLEKRMGQDKTGEGFVYFIVEADTGRVKIGSTYGDISGRLAALKTGSSHALHILGYIKTTNNEHKATEKALHIMFNHLKINGEWFAPGAELVHEFKKHATQVLDNPPYPWTTDEIDTEKRIAVRIYSDAD